MAKFKVIDRPLAGAEKYQDLIEALTKLPPGKSILVAADMLGRKAPHALRVVDGRLLRRKTTEDGILLWLGEE